MSLRKKDQYRPPDDALWMIPLGGCGEIGMNLYLYGTCGKWLMVECGVMFGDETTPGIEIIMPDISFIAERRADLVGLVVTHGHEDHIGAIERLWPHLQCPVYASPFTTSMIRSKLDQAGLKGQVRLIDLPRGGSFEIGPFKAELVRVTHSVPEAHMVSLTTPHGCVVHTGDWKLDPDPVVGDLTDEARFKEIGREGVLAVMGDSTNAMVPTHSLSERDVQKSFLNLFGNYKNRIIVTCFASNIARLKSIAVAAAANGRYVALVGRSLWRNSEIAESHGYLPEFSNFLSEHEAMQAPRDKVVLVCTGCQGEVRAALTRVALGDHPVVEFEKGDTVIFSSRNIPGNEKAVGRVQNLLISQGLQLLTPDSALVHVSGHAGKPEIAKLYEWLQPKLVVPVHGELRHQTAHAEIAKECQVPATLIPENGQIVRLGPGLHEIAGEVPVGRLGLDGKILRALDREAVKGRRKMSFSGAAVVSLALDHRGDVLQAPQVTLLGLEDDAFLAQLRDDLGEAIESALMQLSNTSRQDDGVVKNTVQQTARRFLNATQGKKPLLEVHLMRV
jgi:ribonuclease J